MTINEAFAQLVNNNQVDNKEDIQTTIDGIDSKIDASYYDNQAKDKHYILAGSMGRGTSIRKKSDVDVCFVLPNSVYERFEARQGNVQSQLLTEVKEKLVEKYSRTDLNTDGQVVDLDFTNYLVEVLPCFKLLSLNNELTHPDSHDSGNGCGAWKGTNPLKQIATVNEFSLQFKHYKELCQIVRCWRRSQNIVLKGILIDTFVFKCFYGKSDDSYKKDGVFSYKDSVVDFFKYISGLNETNQWVWDLSDHDYIHIADFGFIKKAKKSLKKMDEDDEETLWGNLQDLFGDGFPDYPTSFRFKNTEEYIGDKFPVRITNRLKIECDISQDGFRESGLYDFLKKYGWLPHKKTLWFSVTYTDVEKPYDIYWKIRNIGEVAQSRDCIRGQIKKGEVRHKETTEFYGPHFVECYIVKNGICVAKDRLIVPIER